MDRVSALGLVIAEHRRVLGLTQPQLAERASISEASVSLVERGETRVAVDTLFAIADVLGVAASELLSRAEADASRRELVNRRPKKRGADR